MISAPAGDRNTKRNWVKKSGRTEDPPALSLWPEFSRFNRGEVWHRFQQNFFEICLCPSCRERPCDSRPRGDGNTKDRIFKFRTCIHSREFILKIRTNYSLEKVSASIFSSPRVDTVMVLSSSRSWALAGIRSQ